MSTKTQLLIDRLVAKPIAYLMNAVTRFLGFILNIDHNLDRKLQTIVICKFKGMGSIIQSTPMLKSIRSGHPNAKIIFVSIENNRAFIEKIDCIDEIITINDKGIFKFISSNIMALFKLIKAKPDIYFDLEIYSEYSTLFTLFSLSRNRVGFYLRSSSYNMGIYTHMMYFNPYVPISKAYLQMAKLINGKDETSELHSLKTTNPPEIEGEYIVINVNASDLRLERRWSPENFIGLIKNIGQQYPTLKIILIGSKSEALYTKKVTEEVKDYNVIDTSGKTNLNSLINLISNAKLMISNDTGPMHIAFTTDTPIICLFGPCSPIQYGTSKFAHIIYKKTYCSPCVHDFSIPPCKGHNICMQLITINEVFTKFNELMITPQLTPSDNTNEDYKYKHNQKVLGEFKR